MNYKNDISNIVESLKEVIISANDNLWHYSEIYFKESKSANELANLANQAGFNIDMGVSGMPTAFVAKWGETGPKIGFLAEYDALPGLSQQCGLVKKQPAEGTVAEDNGHGCGHNNLGAGALGAALALKEYCVKNNVEAQIYLYGCPGEENGSGKMFMARDGLFDCLDACFTWHPEDKNYVIGIGSLASLSIKFKFHGITSHAAATPHLGRSALDACELMNMGVNYLREHIIPEGRIHYSYLDAGGKAPNVVQDYACTYYFVRAPKAAQAFEIADRVYDIAKGAALMTGTTLEIITMDGLSDYIPNKTLSETMAEAFKEIGGANWDEQEIKLAKEYAQTFPPQQIAASKLESATYNKVDVAFFDDIYLDNLVPDYLHNPEKVMPGSTDVGDTSYCVPTAQCNVATCALGTPGHSWQMTGQGATSAAHKGTLVAAKVMALTALKTILNPEIINKAKQEHKVNVPNGYICPTPIDFMPDLE